MEDSMAKVDPIPNQNELKIRREPKWILDPSTDTKKEVDHLRRWAYEKVKKYEERMSLEMANGMIVATGDVEPEEPDVGSVYRFPDLHWIIYKDDPYFSFQLFSKRTSLLKIPYIKI
jgi:hypothetical protein